MREWAATAQALDVESMITPASECLLTMQYTRTYPHIGSAMSAPTLPGDGLVAFVKRECPTCTLIEPQLREVARAVPDFRAVSQDDPQFPAGVQVIDDRELDISWLNNIEFTPTLIRYSRGHEIERIVAWDRTVWQRLTGIDHLGRDLPAFSPG